MHKQRGRRLVRVGARRLSGFVPSADEKGCHTWGRTYDEALIASVREAVELYVEDLRESGSRIPVDPELGGLEWPTPAVAVNL